MDAAEAWLQANDPDYPESRKAWRDINDDGEYVAPAQEIPWGSAADIARLLDTGTGRSVTPASARHCKRCDQPFIAQTSWHAYCSTECWEAARPKRKPRDRADYMRDYRARRAA